MGGMLQHPQALGLETGFLTAPPHAAASSAPGPAPRDPAATPHSGGPVAGSILEVPAADPCAQGSSASPEPKLLAPHAKAVSWPLLREEENK